MKKKFKKIRRGDPSKKNSKIFFAQKFFLTNFEHESSNFKTFGDFLFFSKNYRYQKIFRENRYLLFEGELDSTFISQFRHVG